MMHHKITKVPDDTRGDCLARPSTWGFVIGERESTGHFYCNYCNETFIVNFPRYDKILERTNYIEDVANKNWPCPGCVQKTLKLVKEEKKR